MDLADPHLTMCRYALSGNSGNLQPYFQEAQYKGSIWVIHYDILLERELYFL